MNGGTRLLVRFHAAHAALLICQKDNSPVRVALAAINASQSEAFGYLPRITNLTLGFGGGWLAVFPSRRCIPKSNRGLSVN